MHSLRYFFLLSFMLVSAAFVLLASFSQSYVENEIIKVIAEDNNTSIANNFQKTVWRKYKKTFLYLPCSSKKCPNTELLEKDIKRFIAGLPILRFSIYGISGKNMLSGEDIFKSSSSNQYKEAFLLAKKGTLISYVAMGSSRGEKKLNKVHTFIPILKSSNIVNNERTLAVLEIVYDITSFWDNSKKILFALNGGIILILGGILWMMYRTSARTEQVITKQYEANLELVSAKTSAEEENKAKSQFLANISHELRTPLNAIIGFSEIIKDEVMGPLNNKQYQDYIMDIHLSGVHLLSLINDILDYSKAEAGKLDVYMEEVDVTKIMNTCLRLVSPRAAEAEVTLIGKIPKEHYILKIDGKRLKQVLLNLFSNSVKFTPAGGTVTLYAWNNLADNKFLIEVQDTGVGIAPKDISKVMATFGQVENKLSRRYEGTGLGLPLSKKLVELMNGSLQIKSRVGKGTTITVSLPYITPKDQVESVVAKEENEIISASETQIKDDAKVSDLSGNIDKTMLT